MYPFDVKQWLTNAEKDDLTDETMLMREVVGEKETAGTENRGVPPVGILGLRSNRVLVVRSFSSFLDHIKFEPGKRKLRC